MLPTLNTDDAARDGPDLFAPLPAITHIHLDPPNTATYLIYIFFTAVQTQKSRDARLYFAKLLFTE